MRPQKLCSRCGVILCQVTVNSEIGGNKLDNRCYRKADQDVEVVWRCPVVNVNMFPHR